MFSTDRFAAHPRHVIACCMLLLSPGCAPGTSALANPAEDAVKQEIALVPDLEIQKQIGKVLNPGSDGARRDELQVLAEMGGANYEKLIPQLLYYSVYGTDPAGKHDLKEGMALAGVSDLLKISQNQIATALLPFLNPPHSDSLDEKLRQKLREVFDGFDSTFFQELLQSRLRTGKDLPLELVPYMYQRNPAEALLTMARTMAIHQTWEESRKQWRSLIWAEHIVSDTLWKHDHEFLDPTQVEPEAAAQIEKLAGDNEWWVRLYAAEILRQHPGFRRSELLQKLAQDDHPLVRQSAAGGQVKPEPAAPPPKPATDETQEQRK